MNRMKKKILIIEDQDKWHKLIEVILIDYTLDFAKSYNNAITYLYDNRYSLVIIDICLDISDKLNIDGLKLVKHIKNKFPNQPIIVLTGYLELNDLNSFRKLQSLVIYEKPILDIEIFKNQINSLLK